MQIEKNVLLKTKNSIPQMELSREERLKNLKGAFAAQNTAKIYGKTLLLVDDVYTTGATMQEAALILKMSGAKKVIGLCLARS